MAKVNSAKYSLQPDGSFVIENYHESKPFSNFFPGIAGVWGIPMWVFYVNRGQGIASFGLQSKDKAIMEFHAANKSYRTTPLQGFRTFINVKQGSKTVYWEPFQHLLKGTDFKKNTRMIITAHDLTIEEENLTLGLKASVNYFTIPEEPYAGLVRRLSIQNTKNKSYQIEVIDGLPMIMPYGMTEWLMKHMSRTVEAWMKVHNVEKKAPFYHLNVEVSDKPQVTHIKEGHYYFAFTGEGAKAKLLDPIVEAPIVFGAAYDFAAPEVFLNGNFRIPPTQYTSNRTPSAMSFAKTALKAKGSVTVTSVLGYTQNVDQLNKAVKQITKDGFISQKAEDNKRIIDGVKQFALTNSASSTFNQYAECTFLDNILRGGLPISLKTTEGNVSFNVYSRKHGDLERDYNYFTVAPTFFSQGNGNYRDVNQNRRNDVWFNADVKHHHIVSFMNLIQADGYNPLVVKGTSFSCSNKVKLNAVLAELVRGEAPAALVDSIIKGFLPGDLLLSLEKLHVHLKVSVKEFLGRILEICHKLELADHGEGFWSDHWTYNLDLIESYLSIYPDDLKGLLLDRKEYSFYWSNHYVLPRTERYILNSNGVRQYESLGILPEKEYQGEKRLRAQGGKGEIYHTHLLGKLLSLIANKAATLDASGVGIEMEADKPNWYDALNGLPGLLGSSVSETVEVQRFAKFVLKALNQLKIEQNQPVLVYEELAAYLNDLTAVLKSNPSPYDYWMKANEAKEKYRSQIRRGISGAERALTIADIKALLTLIVERMGKAIGLAYDDKGFLTTYFYHDVKEHQKLEKSADGKHTFVMPTKLNLHRLPLFLEGFVHALRVAESQENAKALYQKVRQSDLFDRKLKMYKVNASLGSQTEEIGRTRIFPSGWLENESIWLHMEYKFMLELLRSGLYAEFYDNMPYVMVPFLKASTYGRSVLENSSFIVSSAHEDASLHGQGFVARLSGSTAEFLHMWLLMNVGKNPFTLNGQGQLTLTFNPILTGSMFTTNKTVIDFLSAEATIEKIELPKNTYAFKLFGKTLVVYHNPRRQNTFGSQAAMIKEIHLTYSDKKDAVILKTSAIPEPYSKDIRARRLARIDVYFG